MNMYDSSALYWITSLQHWQIDVVMWHLWCGRGFYVVSFCSCTVSVWSGAREEAPVVTVTGVVAAVVSGTGVVSGAWVVSGAGTVVGDRIVAIAVMCSVVKCSGRLKYRNTFFCQYFLSSDYWAAKRVLYLLRVRVGQSVSWWVGEYLFEQRQHLNTAHMWMKYTLFVCL